MKCDKCGTLIGNTVYTVGTRELCPICWLGKEEGSKSKYQKFDNKWTKTKLKKAREVWNKP